MKIKPEHFAAIESGVKRVLAENPTITVDVYASQQLTAKRFRWDCLWAAIRKGYTPRIGREANGDMPIYDYADDTHIDTALRKITGTK